MSADRLRAGGLLPVPGTEREKVLYNVTGID
jgi:hypothetical protein